MRFRNTFRFVTVALAGFLLQACTKSDANNSTDFKVALLSPGPITDSGWNAAAYEGLLKIEDELGARISQIETKNSSEFEQAFRYYANDGYRLVFGHGFEFQDAAAKVSADYPHTVFITTSGSTIRDNLAPMVFELEHATYLAGALAAMMTKTKKLGAIGGMKIPSVESPFLAFAAGAGSTDPEVRVIESYIGNWEDADAAKKATLDLIDQGCDLIIHNADAAAVGVFEAIKQRNVYCFGTNKNQNSIDEKHVIASCVSAIPNAFLEMAKIVKGNEFKPKIFRLGMPEHTVEFVINPKLEKKIPQNVLDKLQELKVDILTKKIEVPTLI